MHPFSADGHPRRALVGTAKAAHSLESDTRRAEKEEFWSFPRMHRFAVADHLRHCAVCGNMTDQHTSRGATALVVHGQDSNIPVAGCEPEQNATRHQV